MNPYVAEFIGTMLLILFGNGVVANVVLARTKGNNSGWIVITAGWGFAVYIGAFCSAKASGAHLNPAITIALLAQCSVTCKTAIGYIAAQMLGAFMGGCLVYLFYREHFAETDDANGKMACFCTSPNIRNLKQAFLCEMIGTFALMFPILLIALPCFTMPGAAEGEEVLIGLGSLGLIPVALLVFGIGLSLGGTTGYAINPARDLGPRLAHALLPIPGKRDSDWQYAWVPVLGPIVGALIAVGVYMVVV